MNRSDKLISVCEGQEYVTLISKGNDIDKSMQDAEAAFKEMLAPDVDFEEESLVVDDNPDGIYFSYPAKFLDKFLFDPMKYKYVKMKK